MACINADTRDFWNQLARDLEPQRPSAGKRVAVVGGRKHKGKTGTVVRHQVSRFGEAYRYGSDANHHMRDMMGRYGWACQIQVDSRKPERIWIDADRVVVLITCPDCGADTYAVPDAETRDARTGEMRPVVALDCSEGCGFGKVIDG